MTLHFIAMTKLYEMHLLDSCLLGTSFPVSNCKSIQKKTSYWSVSHRRLKMLRILKLRFSEGKKHYWNTMVSKLKFFNIKKNVCVEGWSTIGIVFVWNDAFKITASKTLHIYLSFCSQPRFSTYLWSIVFEYAEMLQ